MAEDSNARPRGGPSSSRGSPRALAIARRYRCGGERVEFWFSAMAPVSIAMEERDCVSRDRLFTLPLASGDTPRALVVAVSSGASHRSRSESHHCFPFSRWRNGLQYSFPSRCRGNFWGGCHRGPRLRAGTSLLRRLSSQQLGHLSRFRQVSSAIPDDSTTSRNSPLEPKTGNRLKFLQRAHALGSASSHVSFQRAPNFDRHWSPRRAGVANRERKSATARAVCDAPRPCQWPHSLNAASHATNVAAYSLNAGSHSSDTEGFIGRSSRRRLARRKKSHPERRAPASAPRRKNQDP